MTRALLALMMGVVVLSGVDAQDEAKKADDPIAAELAKAKGTYQAAVKAAGTTLIAAIESEDKKAEKNPKLTAEQYSRLSKQLAEERKAFQADPSKLPVSPVTKDAVTTYQKVTSDARTKCAAAFEKAAQAYRGKNNVLMDAVLAEKDLFTKGGSTAVDTFFNGTNLSGWKGLAPLWSVRDGSIVGSTMPDGIKFHTCLVSDKQYGDFELKCKIKLNGPEAANSGIQIRSQVVDAKQFQVEGRSATSGKCTGGVCTGRVRG